MSHWAPVITCLDGTDEVGPEAASSPSTISITNGFLCAFFIDVEAAQHALDVAIGTYRIPHVALYGLLTTRLCFPRRLVCCKYHTLFIHQNAPPNM
jgi:hypothetical protein